MDGDQSDQAFRQFFRTLSVEQSNKCSIKDDDEQKDGQLSRAYDIYSKLHFNLPLVTSDDLLLLAEIIQVQFDTNKYPLRLESKYSIVLNDQLLSIVLDECRKAVHKSESANATSLYTAYCRLCTVLLVSSMHVAFSASREDLSDFFRYESNTTEYMIQI